MPTFTLATLKSFLHDPNKPATPKQLDAFVKKLKFAPPADYVEFLKLANGSGIKFKPSDEGDVDLVLYGTAESLSSTRDYEFDKHAPGVIIIGTDFFDRVFALDGRYTPARIIGTYFGTPGDVGSSVDFGERFLGFLTKLMKDESIAPGLPPLPGAAPTTDVKTIALEDLRGIRADPVDGGLWVRVGPGMKRMRLPSGELSEHAPLLPTGDWAIGAGGLAIVQRGEPVPGEVNSWETITCIADAKTGKIRHDLGIAQFGEMTFDGRAVVLYSVEKDPDQAVVVDLQSGEGRYRVAEKGHQLTISPDGKWIARHDHAGKKIHLDELVTGKRLWSGKRGSRFVSNFIFPTGGRTLVGKEFEGKILGWDLATGKAIFKSGDRDHPAGDLYLVPNSPTGDFISANMDRACVVLWNGETGEPRRKLMIDSVKQGYIGCGAPTVTCDGKFVVVPTQSSKLVIWPI